MFTWNGTHFRMVPRVWQIVWWTNLNHVHLRDSNLQMYAPDLEWIIRAEFLCNLTSRDSCFMKNILKRCQISSSFFSSMNKLWIGQLSHLPFWLVFFQFYSASNFIILSSPTVPIIGKKDIDVPLSLGVSLRWNFPQIS